MNTRRLWGYKRIRGFDRTPLLIGIVVIPLAASCAFGFGAFGFSRVDIRPERPSPLELRILASDRDRRDEVAEVLREDESRSRHNNELHTYHSVPPGLNEAAEVPPGRAGPERLIFRDLADRPALSFQGVHHGRAPPVC